MILNNSINSNSLFLPGNKNREFNFSMEKSEYIPTNTTFDDKANLFNFRTNLKEEEYNKIIPNRYLDTRNSAYSITLAEEYFKAKLIFNQHVIELSEAKFHFNASLLNNPYTSKYKVFPYKRAFFGGSRFKVGETVFIGNKKAVLASFTEEVNSLNYVFTFKTKYIEELQRALLKGTTLKAEWFTVFIANEISAVMHTKGYTKAFKNKFITPFEQQGIEVNYIDNIFQEIAFTKVEKESFNFKFTSRKRDERALEMAQVMVDFKNHELNKLILQENWEIGIVSKRFFREWKISMKSTYLLETFISCVDENYYTGIELVEGMQRTFYLGEDKTKIEFYFDNNWQENNFLGDLNPLEITFSIFKGLDKEELKFKNYWDIKLDIIKVDQILNFNYSSYKEGAFLNNFIDDSYYEVKDYKGIEKVISVEKPLILFVDTKTWFYDSVLEGYHNELNLYNLSLGYDLPSYTMTFSELQTRKGDIIDDCLIYTWDTRVKFIKKKGLLFKDNSSFLNIDELIFLGGIPYDTDTVLSMLKGIPPSFLLSGNQLKISEYYMFEVVNVIETIKESAELYDEIPIVYRNGRALLNPVTLEEGDSRVFNDKPKEIWISGRWVTWSSIETTYSSATTDIFDIEPSNVADINREQHEF